MTKEWKCDKFWKKIVIVLGIIWTIFSTISFMYGFYLGWMGLY